jgi:hypothetical protein
MPGHDAKWIIAARLEKPYAFAVISADRYFPPCAAIFWIR